MEKHPASAAGGGEYVSEARLRAIQAGLNRMYRLLVLALVVLMVAAAGSVACGVLLLVEGLRHSREKANVHENLNAFSEHNRRVYKTLERLLDYQRKLHESQRAFFDQMRPKYGRVTVVVSWLYNKTLGHRPDVNSVVILLPRKLDKKLRKTPLLLETKRFEFDCDHPRVYVGWVGVDGRCVFSRVEPGNYRLFIVSANTRVLEIDSEQRKKIEKEWQKYFSESIIGLNKVFFTDVIVHPGDTIEINHDFGPTAF